MADQRRIIIIRNALTTRLREIWVSTLAAGKRMLGLR